MNIARDNKLSSIVFIVIGFLLYEFSTALQIFYGSDRLFKLLGLFLIFVPALLSKKRAPKGTTKKLLIALLFVQLLMVIIGVFNLAFRYDPFDESLRNLFRNLMFYTHSPLTYLIPFAAFLPFTINDFKKLTTIGIIIIGVQIVLFIMNRGEMFNPVASITGRTSLLSESGDFLTVRQLANSIFSGVGLLAFLTWSRKYINEITFWILISGIFLAFASIVAGGGRGTSFVILGYIITAFAISNYGNKLGILKLGVLFLILAVVLVYLYNNTSVFDFLFNRMFEDESQAEFRESGRESFTNALIADFNNTPLNWLFGRGIYGAYILPDGDYREAMEWGWLYQILKGGIIYLVTYVGILLYSFKKAVFNSNNMLMKAMGFLCLWQVIELIPFGLPSMTAKYFLVWLFVGVISQKGIRELHDKDILQLLKKK